MIRKGQRVRIKPEWQEGGEDDYQWFAVDDEEFGRVSVMAIMPGMSINPIETLSASMLESAQPPFMLPPPEVLEADL